MMNEEMITKAKEAKSVEELIALAKENGIVVMTTEKRMYDSCGLLYVNGLQGARIDG